MLSSDGFAHESGGRYRDFGDKVQYEGPFNFHSEEDLPRLVKKLEDIKADGGKPALALL